MKETTYEDLNEYTGSVERSLDLDQTTPGSWDDIARDRSLDLMNSASDAENLDNRFGYKWVSIHQDEKAGPWTAWTEEEYAQNLKAGGLVRTVVLSGSNAAFKSLVVDKDIDTDYLTVVNDVSVGKDLTVARTSSLKGNVNVGKNLSVAENAIVSGNLDVAGSSSVQDLTVSGNLDVTGDTLLEQDLQVNGDSNLQGVLTVSGNAELGSLTVLGTSSFQDKATFETTSVFKQDLYVEGDLYVQGSASYLNVSELYVEDKSITVAYSASSSEQADGAGFDIAGAGVEFHYDSETDNMTLNKSLEILGTGSIIASTGSFGDVQVNGSASIEYLEVNNFSSSGEFNADAVSASYYYGDGRYLTNITASIASSSTYRSYLDFEAGASQEVTHPFNTTDVFVQVYKWEDENFHPETGFGLATGSQGIGEYGDSFSVPSILVSDAVVKITGTSSVEISYPEALNGYAVISDAGMLITGSIDVFECTTDVAEFNIPSSSAATIFEYSHRLGTKNVIVTFYKYSNIRDELGNIEPVKWNPEQVSIPDKNHIKVVYGNTNEDVSGYMVIAKAGHVVKESQIDESWIIEHGVHYGDDGDWEANSFTATTMSTDTLAATEFIDTPKIGNLSTGDQYYNYYDDNPLDLWGSYIEFTDRGIASYVRTQGHVPGSDEYPEDWSEETAEIITTASLLDSNGDLYLAGGVITNHSNFSLSDIREKQNITPLTDVLSNVQKLRGVKFEWKSNGAKEIGTIAQEVQSIYPELTREYRTIQGDQRLAVNYDGLVGVLIEAVKELSTKVSNLEEEIRAIRDNEN